MTNKEKAINWLSRRGYKTLSIREVTTPLDLNGNTAFCCRVTDEGWFSTKLSSLIGLKTYALVITGGRNGPTRLEFFSGKPAEITLLRIVLQAFNAHNYHLPKELLW